jgi:hypothetical protein
MTEPIKRKPGRHTFDSSNTRHNISRLLTALETPQTHKQLRETLFFTERTLNHYLKHLRAAPNRRVRVKSWILVRSRWLPVLALGAAPDAVQPKQTAKERNAKRRAKVKADPELLAARKRREQARWLVKKIKAGNIKPQTWFSALHATQQEGAAC